GSLAKGKGATITGNVDEYSGGQYSGRGALGGVVITDAALMTESDQDALFASAVAKSLSPTQSFGNLKKATTVNGNGGLNVINVAGDITASITLNGSASDGFIVNVSGNLQLRKGEGVNLSGGVTADHVILNFVGTKGTVSENQA